MKIQHPHNNLFEKVMELKGAVSALILHFFPQQLLAELDLSTLKQESRSFITDELAPLFSDIIYSCKWKNKTTYLSFLFEHKSKYELPDLQLLSYTVHGYKKQAAQWQMKIRQLKKDKGKNTKSAKYVPSLILPILIYHGKEKWQDKSFTDLFELPDKQLHEFIPSINYLLINLKQHPDDQLETIEMKILLGMLLLFKHKGDKEYVLKNFQKIFIFVEEDAHGNIIETYTKLFVFYIYQTFNLKTEDVMEIIPELPKPVKEEFISTYDILIKEGYDKGSAEGILKGEIKGALKGEIKTKFETLVELMIKFPNWTNELLSEISKIAIPSIVNLKKAFKGKRKKTVLLEARKLFVAIPDLQEKQLTEIDKLATRLWKRYQKSLKA